MELVIKGERKGEGKTMKAYELGSYSVSVVTYDEGWQSVCIKKNEDNRYQPSIFSRTDDEWKLTGFDIMTTSYGALQPDQIRKVIDGMEEAIQAVEILTKEFVKEA